MKAYTYLIGWSKLNLWYYGLRYAKNCSMNDLWTKYYTSSREVIRCREFNGEPDFIQVRKTFSDPLIAIEWEHKVLRRMNVTKSTKWLNNTDNRCMFNNKDTLRNSHSPAANRKRSAIMSQKIWITNGVVSKRVSVSDEMDFGWYRGRTIVHTPKFTKMVKKRAKSMGCLNKNKVLAYDLVERKSIQLERSIFLTNKNRYCGITSSRIS